ncbi:nitroreductase family protein [Candidatus Woesearchaeota archaeon]|nr:nitroreductase family protein [Candidatus Woesearchaeota archaeon]
MELFEAIKTRKSIRKFKDKPVEKEKIIKIIEAATLAPNSENKQPWKFVVVQDKDKKKEIAKISILGGIKRYTSIKDELNEKFKAMEDENRKKLLDRFVSGELFHFLLECPVQVVVLADNNIIYAVHSCSAAIQNLSLAAHALGLGSCWTMIGSINSKNEKKIRKLVGYPEDNWKIAGVLALGYPDQDPNPRKRKPVEEVIDWQ